MTVFERINDDRCGCDDIATGRALISIDSALDAIARATRPVSETEVVPLEQARGRVLAKAVRSVGMVPPFDNAAMDGYAVRAADMAGDGPWDLAVAGRIKAGQGSLPRLPIGGAVQVFTGAPVPLGADAVVMQEKVARLGNRIRLQNAVTPGQHIRRAGEDMKSGKIVVPTGAVLSSRAIAACAAAGQDTVCVTRPLRVALVVTGDEVVQPGQVRGSAGIWDINTPMLRAEIAQRSVALTHIHVARDTRDALAAQLADLAREVDVIVTTGGISVGEEDHVKPALSALGADMAFSGVAIKPGKPVSFGRLGQCYWLGLPGNPLSAFVTWQIFGKALCAALTGCTGPSAPRRHVKLGRSLRHKPGRCELRPARLTGFDADGLEVALFEDATHSGRVARLCEMDGLLFIPADTDTLPSGALAEFHPF